MVSNISDEIRFKRWIVACNNPRIQKMDPMSVHKRYRICRRHFDSECLNGGCRRLLNSAVPTLFLQSSQSSSESNADSDESSNLITTARNIIYIPVSTDDTEEHFELVLTEDKTLDSSNDVKGPHFFQMKLSIVVPLIFQTIRCIFLVLNAEVNANSNVQVHLAAKRKSEEMHTSRSGGDKYGYLKEIHTKHKFKKQKTEEGGMNGDSICFNKVEIFQATEFSAIDDEVSSIKLNLSNEIEMQYELLDVEDAKYYKGKNHFTKIADVFFEFRHTSPKLLY